jgi:hypothetical protein
MLRPSLEVLRILRALLALAEKGELSGIFVVFQRTNETYGSEFDAEDPEDMIHQSRTEQIWLAQTLLDDPPDTVQ